MRGSFLIEARVVITETVKKWLEDGIPSRGAALSYYLLLSLGPVLLLLVGGLQFFLADETARSGVLEAIERFVGSRAANTARTVLRDAEPPAGLSLASLITIGLFLFGATAVFANVRGSLNAIWGVERDMGLSKELILGFLRTRVLGFLMIVLTGLLLMVSFVLTSVASIVVAFLEDTLPFRPFWVQALDIALSIGVIGLLFAMILRTLPAIRIGWSAVWVGGYVTATLFVLMKVLIARFIAGASWASYYGPGASVVAFIFWVYLSAQVFFLGAEFTQVWAIRRGAMPDERPPGGRSDRSSFTGHL